MVYEGLRDDKSAAEVRREVLHPKLYSCVLPIDSRSAQIPDLRTYAELANAESTDGFYYSGAAAMRLAIGRGGTREQSARSCRSEIGPARLQQFSFRVRLTHSSHFRNR